MTMKYRAITNFHTNGRAYMIGEVAEFDDETATELLRISRIVKFVEPVVERQVQKPVVSTRKKR